MKGEVSLSVYVKNVSRLVVKVFKINARAYFRSKLQEVSTSLELDGLTPHEEFVLVRTHAVMHKHNAIHTDTRTHACTHTTPHTHRITRLLALCSALNERFRSSRSP